MRLRTSAALALVIALLAAPLSAYACGLECWPSSASEADKTVEATPSEGSCHRDVEKPAEGGATLGATPHDCATHSQFVPRLSNPGAAASLTKAATITLLPPAGRLATDTLIASSSTSHPRDLAPPGRTAALIAPLRI